MTSVYEDGVFNTAAEYCETFGHDLATGAIVESEAYRARDPKGKAWIKAAEYQPPPEQPDGHYPFWLTTGRVAHHFHTRTKTARAPALNAAAPEGYVQLAPGDAERLGIGDGDPVLVESRRGAVRLPARLGGIVPGHAFIPFHYGYWDAEGRDGRAANELTLSAGDPVSKQPYFKFAAVRIRKG